MEAVAIGLVLSMFSAVSDPRASNARHRLVDIFAITLLAMIAGADDYPGIVEFARDRVDLLSELLALPHGIPSVSTFRRVFAAVDPVAMGEVLGRWSAELVAQTRQKQSAYRDIRHQMIWPWVEARPSGRVAKRGGPAGGWGVPRLPVGGSSCWMLGAVKVRAADLNYGCVVDGSDYPLIEASRLLGRNTRIAPL